MQTLYLNLTHPMERNRLEYTQKQTI